MRIYHIQPDDNDWGKLFKYEINATHAWGLPGIKCLECNLTWSVTGIAYPAVDLSSILLAERYRSFWPVTVEEFNDLSKPLIPLLPKNSIMPPGTDFGPLVGKARGIFGDFAWLNPWTMLIRREILSDLISIGLQLPKGVIPEMRYQSKFPPELIELQVEPLASLAQASFKPLGKPRCPSCGRDSRKIERIIIDQKTVPTHVDLFRLRDHPAKILATQRFFEIVSDLELTDVLFMEVDLSD